MINQCKGTASSGWFSTASGGARWKMKFIYAQCFFFLIRLVLHSISSWGHGPWLGRFELWIFGMGIEYRMGPYSSMLCQFYWRDQLFLDFEVLFCEGLLEVIKYMLNIYPGEVVFFFLPLVGAVHGQYEETSLGVGCSKRNLSLWS